LPAAHVVKRALEDLQREQRRLRTQMDEMAPPPAGKGP
jgi:hypothetical protein